MMLTNVLPVEGVRSLFIGRIEGVDVVTNRDTALSRLRPFHDNLLSGFPPLATAGQVHGAEVVIVDSFTPFPVADVDGLATTSPDITLGIYVADCAAVYLADSHGKAIALLHSGRKGTDLGIVTRGVGVMQQLGCRPCDLVAAISPCIRPPHYEVDFAEVIRRQLSAAGVTSIHDSRECTASSPKDFYSYRREKGSTGRMLAALSLG